MRVELLGVYLDGAPFVADVPRNAARQLDVPLGATLVVALRVVNPGGVDVDLTGAALVLTARRRSTWPAKVRADAAVCSGGAGCGCRACSPARYGEEDGCAPTDGGATPDVQVAGVLDATSSGRATFTLGASATQLLEPGRYVYDVWVTWPDATRDRVVPASPFVVLPAVALPP